MSMESRSGQDSIFSEEIKKVRADAEKKGLSPNAAEKSLKGKMERIDELIEEAKKDGTLKSVVRYIQSQLKAKDLPDSPERLN